MPNPNMMKVLVLHSSISPRLLYPRTGLIHPNAVEQNPKAPYLVPLAERKWIDPMKGAEKVIKILHSKPQLSIYIRKDYSKTVEAKEKSKPRRPCPSSASSVRHILRLLGRIFDIGICGLSSESDSSIS